MMRSMFSGVTGLRNHQTRMDVIGNNIANVNTVGFKSSNVTFRQLLSQTLRGASRPTEQRGGTNPMQIGLGMTVGSINTAFTPSPVENTGNPTDLALDNSGFFVLRDDRSLFYTRAGAFGIDAEGYLADRATGLRVQGWAATNGSLPSLTGENLTDLQLRIGQSTPAKATTGAVLVGNLDANAVDPANDAVPIDLDLFDSLGRQQTMTLTFAPTGNGNEWEVTSSWDPANPVTITFDANGNLDQPAGGTVNFTLALQPEAADLDVELDFSGLTQYDGSDSVKLLSQDGYPSGVLNEFTIDGSGIITGAFSNGVSQVLGQIAVAGFENASGLDHRGGGLYWPSNNSGVPAFAAAGTNGLGSIVSGALEMSNVDLSQEFTSMIVTQRGFQANARVITTSDEMLQELVNLRR